jgi:hypothetical protein
VTLMRFSRPLWDLFLGMIVSQVSPPCTRIARAVEGRRVYTAREMRERGRSADNWRDSVGQEDLGRAP